jgi:hypothetical protein
MQNSDVVLADHDSKAIACKLIIPTIFQVGFLN